jgi:anti-sigma regulatory factor (Ser/Thr protein kinase)
MRSGAAYDHEGFFHDSAFYASDEEFRQIYVPFLLEGVEAEEPVFVLLEPKKSQLLHEAVGARKGTSYLPFAQLYERPVTTIGLFHETVATEVAKGVEQIRFIGEVPHPGMGAAWDWWGQYESVCNHAFAELPIWAICAYDTRTTAEPIIDEAIRAHPFIATPDGRHEHNPRYEDPSTFVRNRTCGYVDPLEKTPPAVELVDPTPRTARHAAIDVATRAALDHSDVDGLSLAVTEVVTNALLHGERPLRVRMWSNSTRVVVAVTDQGPGIPDPMTGFLPGPNDDIGGRGLWIANHVCSHVAMDYSPTGFTVRLVVGQPSAV